MATNFQKNTNSVDVTTGTTKKTYSQITKASTVWDAGASKVYVSINDDFYSLAVADVGTINGAAAPGTGQGIADTLMSSVFGATATIFKLLSAATTNANSIKATPGTVYGWHIYNTAAAAKFVKFYNKASAPTVGTDVPVMTIPIGATSSTHVQLPGGISFALGIAIAITNLVTDVDATAVALNDVVINIFYV